MQLTRRKVEEQRYSISWSFWTKVLMWSGNSSAIVEVRILVEKELREKMVDVRKKVTGLLWLC